MITPRFALAPFTLSSHPAPVDVLVGHAFVMALDPKQAAKARPFPPLASLQLVALLRREGFSVALFDSMLSRGVGDFEAALRAARPRLLLLQEDNFNFLSKMCLARMREEALAMVRLAEAAGLPVLVNGSDASDHPEIYLEAGASAVARGEGDWTLLEAARQLLALPASAGSAAAPGVSATQTGAQPATARRAAWAAALAEVHGLSLGLGADRRDNPARAIERDPDRFPDPDRSFVDLAAYQQLWRHAHGQSVLNLASSRGCPYHCNWCAKPIWGQRYSLRSVGRVVAEIAGLASGPWAPDRLWFADDIFGLHPSWTEAFGTAMAEAGLKLPFQIQSRADLMTEGAVHALAAAGCDEVWLGAESGDQAILDAMEKGITIAQVRRATGLLRQAGIRVGLFLQFGYPGEDWAALMRTVALVRELLPDVIGISVSYPLPGTRFHDRVKADLGEQQHWQDSQELAMLYRGPFPSAIYRQVHRLLHRELDLRLALQRCTDSAETSRLQRRLALAAAAWRRLEKRALRSSASHGDLAAAPRQRAAMPAQSQQDLAR